MAPDLLQMGRLIYPKSFKVKEIKSSSEKNQKALALTARVPMSFPRLGPAAKKKLSRVL